MTTERDTTRLVRSWLRVDEHENADRILENVLGALDATPQRRRIWPARRVPTMNSYAKLALAAAAVVVIAIAGLKFLPGNRGPGGTLATPTPTLASNGSFPPPGAVAVGRHAMILEGIHLTVDVAKPGWTASPYGNLQKGDYGTPASIGTVFWSNAPDNVYADPCAHSHLDPAPAHTAAAMAAVVSTLAGTDLVTAPTSVSIGGASGQHVAVKIRDDITCLPSEFWRWYNDSLGAGSDDFRDGARLGATISVWIFEVEGRLVWIDGETFEGATSATTAELQAIIDSIRFE
jgi:hypothetical protein